ncbi:MAG: hypothetical protein R3C01_04480 [Planctomycetaceae bacterium]
MSADSSSYERLNSEQLVDTMTVLERRIAERFPQAGLRHVAQKLLEITRKAQSRAAKIDSPLVWIRLLSAVIIVSLLAMLGGAIWTASHEEGAEMTAAEVIQVAEAGLNELVAIGVTIFFLVTLETRFKRRRVLEAIHELRVLSHIIDMHQLTKDPERLLSATFKPTASSPKPGMSPFLLNRYLDYCSEMLSLTGKIAVLYVQNFADEQAVAAVNDIEDLTSGLSRKIWQKIMVLHSRMEVSEVASTTKGPFVVAPLEAAASDNISSIHPPSTDRELPK